MQIRLESIETPAVGYEEIQIKMICKKNSGQHLCDV